jgi:hypothetical protein
MRSFKKTDYRRTIFSERVRDARTEAAALRVLTAGRNGRQLQACSPAPACLNACAAPFSEHGWRRPMLSRCSQRRSHLLPRPTPWGWSRALSFALARRFPAARGRISPLLRWANSPIVRDAPTTLSLRRRRSLLRSLCCGWRALPRRGRLRAKVFRRVWSAACRLRVRRLRQPEASFSPPNRPDDARRALRFLQAAALRPPSRISR